MQKKNSMSERINRRLLILKNEIKVIAAVNQKDEVVV